MGWRNWWKKAAEKVVETVESVVDFVTATASSVIDAVTGAVGNLIDGVSDKAIEAAIESADAAFENYTPANPDLTRFEPVVPDAEQVQSTTAESADWSNSELTEVRDAVAAAQLGYADYSDLLAAGAVDADGYVINSDILYDAAGWLGGIVDWASDRFEIVRVLEDASSSLFGGYEANVTLIENNATGEYFIAVGGTASLPDVLSDINLLLTEDTGASEDAISDMIAQFFADDIADGATVNLAGHSLGGAEAVLQYRDDPDAFDQVYAIQSVGIGGIDGTYYDRNVWDGVGDANITEITGDDAGSDFNDLVTYWGHIGAGQTYHVEDVIQADDEDEFFSDLDLVDSHLLDNLWASLPGGENPILPEIETDVFMFG